MVASIACCVRRRRCKCRSLQTCVEGWRRREVTEAHDTKGQEPIIRVENCSVVFGRRAKQALEMRRAGKSKAEVERATGSTIGAYDASFDVYKGEIFVIIGLSGSGKSTILRAINGLNDLTEGKVYLEDDLVSEMPIKQLRAVRRRKIGMVFQHFGLLPHRTVLDNIAFGLEIEGVPVADRKKKAEETLPEVGLEGQGNKLIAELSGGMKQRVGLARALATEQEILLMDEPFSALDALIRREMQNLFLSIQGEAKRTVVFVTHDLDEALTLGHRVAIMKDGEIVQLGTPEYILREPANQYVERFVEGVDYAKVRLAESVMVKAKEVAYTNEGPTVVLRRMRQGGLSHIFVLDSERRLVGLCEAEEVARLAERDKRELRDAVDEAPKIGRRTPLREVLPLFVGDGDVPVAVVGGGERLEGLIVRGAHIAGLTTSVEPHDEEAGFFAVGTGPKHTAGRVDRERGRLDHRQLRMVLRSARLRDRSRRWLARVYPPRVPRAAHGRHPGRDRLSSGELEGGAVHGVGPGIRNQPGPVGGGDADPGAGPRGDVRRAGDRHPNRHYRGQIGDRRDDHSSHPRRRPDDAGLRVPGSHRCASGDRGRSGSDRDGRLRHASGREADYARYPAGTQGHR